MDNRKNNNKRPTSKTQRPIPKKPVSNTKRPVSKKPTKKPVSQSKGKTTQNKSNKITYVIIAVASFIGVLIISLLVYFIVGSNLFLSKSNHEEESKKDNSNKSDTTYVEYIDANEYFGERADIKSVIPVSKSKKVMHEKEVSRMLKKRGFTDLEVTSEYSVDGLYYDAQSVSTNSREPHPMYNAFFIAENGDYWKITIINDQIMATPISYNYKLEKGPVVIISESETLTSYDSGKNQFFITVPNDKYVKVKIVDTINAKTLNELTSEEIDKL